MGGGDFWSFWLIKARGQSGASIGNLHPEASGVLAMYPEVGGAVGRGCNTLVFVLLQLSRRSLPWPL